MAKQDRPSQQAEPIPEHFCNQERRLTEMESTITELYHIITGNGTPEKGMTSQIAVIKSEQVHTNTTLARIEQTLKSQDEKYAKAVRVAYVAKNDLDIHKAESSGKDQGKTSTTSHFTQNWQLTVVTLALVTTIILGILNLRKGTETQKGVTANGVKLEVTK